MTDAQQQQRTAGAECPKCGVRQAHKSGAEHAACEAMFNRREVQRLTTALTEASTALGRANLVVDAVRKEHIHRPFSSCHICQALAAAQHDGQPANEDVP